MLAATEGNLEYIKYFVEKQNASINKQNNSGETSLLLSVKSPIPLLAKLAIIKYFLTHGANPQLQDLNGDTPLHIAASSSQPLITNLLIQYGAFLEIKNNNGETPLRVAVKNNDVTNMNLLFKWGASLENSNENDSDLENSDSDFENGNTVMSNILKIMDEKNNNRRCGTAFIQNTCSERKLVDSGAVQASNSLWWM